jgi:uncharacterized protein (TIGR00369 family)
MTTQLPPLGGFNEALGLEFDDASGDRVVVRCPVGEQLLQPYGIVHGGVYCSLSETSASVGAALWYGDRGDVVGVANQTSFLRATRDGVLTATAEPVHRGRTQQLWRIEITDQAERLVATSEVRIANIASAGHLGKPAPA